MNSTTLGDPAVAHKVARAELWKRILIVFTAFMVLVLLLALLWIAGLIRSTQQNGSPTLKALAAQNDQLAAQNEKLQRTADAAKATNEQIKDCLTPQGACFKASRDRSAQTVADIGQLSAFAAVCADRPGTQSLAELQACIQDFLTAAEAKAR
jgi:hypothetical protein